MLSVDLEKRGAALKVLCLGAHADDIEIGCGGLILSLIQKRRPVDVTWVVFSAPGKREQEARHGARAFLKGARRTQILIRQFTDSHFPYEAAAIKAVYETLKPVAPDLVLVHYRDDRHQDHRTLSDLAWNTFRDHLILEYEIPKFDGDLGQPNCFVPLDRATCRRKVKYLQSTFGTQRDKHWFGEETFMALMRLRGMECRASAGYAEAFYTRKIVFARGPG
jgi:LmbE family N-acetylglucosaminyl deacetylase